MSGGDLEHGAQVLVAGHDVIEALGREKLLEDLGGQGDLPRRQRSLHLGKPILVSISRFEVKKNITAALVVVVDFLGNFAGRRFRSEQQSYDFLVGRSLVN